ncbi:geranylgeranylglyceryl/heptaprenylglyceryl phosphate synthase [Aureibaculum sp. 2210JD6-5]|uniref:geranylgeranylglyceryl/heptaprenylglyceryl phosphate synthase n=1 Tax=Aureibaculum sp. 2210JD6-5 TaxID=3103957 RepID=UPI002AAE0A70|nr:geranylgeranylglyceryl/heptaprenylglyceryl phosphate synthase [Aureibaculum sp. 2210JD6-5]MDY7394789.1 geranylgeranylglyceryl/heptaprenylglyceryl phosphate synthase [Aureibaculum sp. 2210JD6-5]
MNIYQYINDDIQKGKKLLAILLDPDKVQLQNISTLSKKFNKRADLIFVGGSTVQNGLTEKLVEALKKETQLPIILFPGDYTQITYKADALLFLSLLSGDNPEYLIHQQVKSIPKLKNSSLEIIPTGYILIDGGVETSVQKVSNTKPISQKNVELVVNTALAGQYAGKKLIYLEAGSGAKESVSEEIIKSVKTALNIPLIVGGGIRTKLQLNNAYNAGADLVVVGNAFEEDNLWFNTI